MITAMRSVLVALLIGLAACGGMTDAQRDAVRAEVTAALRDAYDLSRPDVEQRMLALYGPTGAIVSASAGQVVTSRDTLTQGIQYFWRNVGVNMRDPTWEWDSLFVEVLSPTSAVVTAAYRIPHLNPRNQPHVIAGAMTAVFVKSDGRWVIVQEHLSDRPQQP